MVDAPPAVTMPGVALAWKCILLILLVAAAWMAMQAVHELGHVLGAWISGGAVERVVLHPLEFSRTDLSDNPHPLLVAWSGPLVGAVMPLVAWTVAAAMRLRIAFVLRFFAGFCLLANGIYLGAGSFGRVGDCGTLLRHGAAIWQLWLFGLLTAPLGLALWHRQSAHFGRARSAAGHGSAQRPAKA